MLWKIWLSVLFHYHSICSWKYPSYLFPINNACLSLRIFSFYSENIFYTKYTHIDTKPGAYFSAHISTHLIEYTNMIDFQLNILIFSILERGGGYNIRTPQDFFITFKVLDITASFFWLFLKWLGRLFPKKSRSYRPYLDLLRPFLSLDFKNARLKEAI